MSIRFRYLIATPFAINLGGTTIHAQSVIEEIANQGYEIKPVDYMQMQIDFDILLVCSYSYHNPDMFEKYREAGVKIVLIPIFDRTKSYNVFEIYKLLNRLPIPTLYGQRKRILDAAGTIIVSCRAEKDDLIKCYNTKPNNVMINHLGINTKFLELDQSTDSSWFESQYGKNQYVVYSAAEINQRKNQMAVIKAIEGSNIKLILTGTHQVKVDGFWEKVQKNPNIICIGEITLANLVSIYKSSHVSISTSSTETAGLANLEAAYFGCNLVVSDIPPFREYCGEIADFLKPDLSDIRTKIESSLQKHKNYDLKNTIVSQYSWQANVERMLQVIQKM
jgi:glycosyltransferase involved in cell wall biosynthesis